MPRPFCSSCQIGFAIGVVALDRRCVKLGRYLLASWSVAKSRSRSRLESSVLSGHKGAIAACLCTTPAAALVEKRIIAFPIAEADAASGIKAGAVGYGRP